MSTREHDTNSDDQQRIVIALGIVATDLAILALPDSRLFASSIIGGLFFLPAVLAFLFIVFTGSHLKFRDTGVVGDLSIPRRLRQWMYDCAINAYWWALILVVLVFTALLFGWDGKTGTFLSQWPSHIISMLILGSIVIIMTIVSQRESSPRQKRAFKKRRSLK